MNAATPSGAFLKRILIASIFTQFTGTFMGQHATFLIPELHLNQGLSLSQAGLVASAPLAGMVLTLALWGTLADRWGPRICTVIGLGGAALCGFVAGTTDTMTVFIAMQFLSGVMVASVNTASGQIILGWFPRERRATAMGFRQASQPVAFAVTAATIPAVAATFGAMSATLLPASVCLLGMFTAVFLIKDPPGRDSASRVRVVPQRNPYRGSSRLLRIHLASVLLIVPQASIWTFALVWLVSEAEFSLIAGSVFVASTQLVGAVARIMIGIWSDRTRERIKPMRQIAWITAVVIGLLAIFASSALAFVLLFAATVLSLAANSINLTIVAEESTEGWVGRVLGLQITGQMLMSALTPPVVGFLVAAAGYSWMFVFAAAMPVLAMWIAPTSERVSQVKG